LKFDNGSEYKSLDFVKLCLENDIMKQCIVTYIPQQNGMSERKNKTLMVRAYPKGKN
jgi:transposase InsO family protein